MFYGWIVVAAAFVVVFVSSGLQHAYGVLLPQIETELGTTRAVSSMPYSLFVLVSSALSLPAGWLTDRFGPRLVIAAGGLALGVGFAAMSTVERAWELMIVFGLLAGAGKCIAFVPPNVTVARWFDRHRGIATGLSTSGASAAVFLAPPVTAVLVDALSWRGACLVMGASGLALIVAAAVLMHRDPESRGLHPDGRPPPSQPHDHGHRAEPAVWTLRSAARTSTFWWLLATFTLAWIMLFAPYVHLPSHALDRDLGSVFGAMLVSVIGVAGLLARPWAGWISDRIGLRPVLAWALTVQCLGFGLMGLVSEPGILAASAGLFGVGATTTIGLFTLLVVRYFGRTHAGTIAGALFTVGALASATGPLIAGFVRDLQGSYDRAFLFGAACSALALLSVSLLRAPTPSSDTGCTRRRARECGHGR